MKIQINKNIIFLIVAGLILPGFAMAAMQSSNYIIYESVMHTFDGPVISAVNHSVSGQSVDVTWNTNIIADGFVIYDTDSGFSSSAEQGSSVKSGTSHSVSLSGLDANTTYYYRIRSERVNGGITTDTTSRNFTTGSDTPSSPPSTPSSGGGGILIIDKTDNTPPEISDVNVENIGSDTVDISWLTDEEATEFVEYGPTIEYGFTYGYWSSSTEHLVILDKLKSETEYHFRAISSDDWGNVAYSDDYTFVTLTSTDEEPSDEEVDEEPDITLPPPTDAIDFITRLFPEISLNELDLIGSLDDLSNYFATPILSGEPNVEVGPTEVTVRWNTDIDANALVALAPESAYQEGASEPYQQIIGNSDVYGTAHEVTLYNLTPDTTYHFQIRSKTRLGPTAKSRDYEFRTSIEELQIVSYLTQIIDNETASFKWVTNKEADANVTFTPYFNGVLAVDQQKTIKDNSLSVVHEIEVSEFVAGTFYEVELASADDKGNIATKILSQFSTTEDDLPPVITHIKADSTVFVDRSNKIQTIISWLTNEPSTSRVYFQEGVHGGGVDLSESTDLNTNYTKEHVIVLSKFKPGIVYSFKVESIDSGGNVTKSKVHTFMTAKKKESIITVIMNILENTFGWVKKII